MHPSLKHVMKYFRFEHLPEGPLRDTSRKFHDLAHEVAAAAPENPETTVAVRNLLLAKDAAVRARLPE